MDTKRLLLAVILSVAIFLGWNAFSLYMGWLPPQPDPASQNAAEPAAPAPAAPAPAAPAPVAEGGAFDAPAKVERPLFTPSEGRPVIVETPLYKAVFHSNGGILQRFELKHYTNSVREDSGLVNLISEAAAAQAPMGILVGGLPSWMGQVWALEGGDLKLDEDGTGVLRFTGEVGGLHLTRELLFEGSSYLIREKLRVSSDELMAANLIFTFSATALASEKAPGIMATLRHLVFRGPAPEPTESVYNPTRVAWWRDNSFKDESSPKSLNEGKTIKPPLSWVAVMNNYFLGAVSMDDPEAQGVARMIGDNVFSARMGKSVTVAQGHDAMLECVYFLGPKDNEQLNAAPNNLDRAINYGFFSVVATPLIWLLRFLYGYVHNYGVAIILMTIIIKFLFWPLSQKSYKSMQQMKQLQPMMAKLREKHAGDRETLNKEIMQLYKTYKVNPASGCLPILIQLPVFLGLYQALLNSIELRHATFIATVPFTDLPWLVDLSSRDPYFITPLIMGATMFLQQKLTPMPGDPMQARIMMFMPIIFTILFLGFPSGLVLYWLVNNVISIGQQWWQLRRTTTTT